MFQNNPTQRKNQITSSSRKFPLSKHFLFIPWFVCRGSAIRIPSTWPYSRTPFHPLSLSAPNLPHHILHLRLSPHISHCVLINSLWPPPPRPCGSYKYVQYFPFSLSYFPKRRQRICIMDRRGERRTPPSAWPRARAPEPFSGTWEALTWANKYLQGARRTGFLLWSSEHWPGSESPGVYLAFDWISAINFNYASKRTRRPVLQSQVSFALFASFHPEFTHQQPIAHSPVSRCRPRRNGTPGSLAGSPMFAQSMPILV